MEKERIEERFRRIQDAYETLSNAAKRREYDSTDEFDDSLPTDCDPADFFKASGHQLRLVISAFPSAPRLPAPACAPAPGCAFEAGYRPPARLLLLLPAPPWSPHHCCCHRCLPSTPTLPQVFTPAFRRNARWSVNPAVPDVGDAAAAWPAVEAFYDFWFAFKSWREFPHPDEEVDVRAVCKGRASASPPGDPLTCPSWLP